MSEIKKKKRLNEQDLYLLCENVFDHLQCSVSITRGDSTFIHANAICEDIFGFSAKDYRGKSVTELQKKGIWNPSITLQVLEHKKKIITTQVDKYGVVRPIEAIPLFNAEGDVDFVICFSAWDSSSFEALHREYAHLEAELHRYTQNVCSLDMQEQSPLGLVTENERMKKIHRLIAQIAPYKACVLFTGESGTGKAFYAQKLHSLGAKATSPFIELHCRAIAPQAIEYELFGDTMDYGSHRGKSEQGGKCETEGALQRAEGGTLLLQGVESLPLDVQMRLAAVMARSQNMHEGGDLKESIGSVRILATTTKDLSKLVQKGRFAKELFYLLCSISIEIPPLRKRPEDLLAFILYFANKKNTEYNFQKYLSQKTLDVMLKYSWPGNIREVLSSIERVFLLTLEDEITPSALPDSINTEDIQTAMSETFTLKGAMDFYEKRILLQAYEKYKTTVAVAKVLGISQPSVARKLARYREEEGLS